MDCWAAYLRGQADALNLPVIDTTSVGIDAVVDALATHVETIRAEVEQRSTASRRTNQ
jgi:hypothetical protein